MADLDPMDAKEKEYGAQEAALFLGIHRSTLHHAVRNGHIIPDSQTPGKHYRFRLATLEAFGHSLKTQAASSEARVVAPIQILANLAHTLAMSDGMEKACQDAVTLLCESHIDVDMACVALRDDKAPNHHGIRLLAQRGFPSWFLQGYASLRPTMRLAVHRVLHTMEPITCSDTMTMSSIDGNDRATVLVRRANIRSYAVLPIPSAGGRAQRAYGVLVVASKKPRGQIHADSILLQGIADQLAVALMEAVLPAVADTRTSRLIVQRSFTALANANGVAPREKVMRLHDIFLEETGARSLCALGFGSEMDIDGPEPRLRELGCRACIGNELLFEQWLEDKTTGAAASVLLRPSHRAAVGALWNGIRRCGEPEHSLLVSFASAYALATQVANT